MNLKNFSKYFIKQKMMRTVIISLIPIIFASIYFFGWRTLILLGIVTIAGVTTEWIFEKNIIEKYQRQYLLVVFYTH